MAQEDAQQPTSRRIMGETIGLMIAAYLVVLLTTAGIVAGGVVAWTRNAKPRTEATACWRIQEAAGRVFKLNACTGETIEIVQERKPTGA